MKSIWLRPIVNPKKEIKIAESEVESTLWMEANKYLKEHNIHKEPYMRYWFEDGEQICDFGSWSEYLVIKTEPTVEEEEK